MSLLAAPLARADDATETWTGQVEAAGNYYAERSTRVVVPTIAARLVAPNGVAVDASYLVDVISSASVAQSGSGTNRVFTELRHGIDLGVGKDFGAGKVPLDLRVHASYSTETDYRSLSYGLTSAFSFHERNSVLRLSIDRLDDEIESNVDPSRHEQLDGIGVTPRWEQVLTRTVTLSTGYTLGYLEGFTANIYRRAYVGPLPHPEQHPRERWRHSADVRLRWFIPESGTAIHVMPSAYLDSWGIHALNPELRVHQELGTPDLLVRLRYRLYAQSAADFYRPGAQYPQGYAGHITNDPKMGAYRSQDAGIKFDVRLRFVEDSFLAFASQGWLYVNFDRIWNTNAYGNGVIGQVGAIVPF